MMASETHEKIRDYLSEIQAEKMTNDEWKIADHQVWGINDRDKLGFQLITSDVAPKTTGRTDDDQYHSLCSV